MPGKVMKMRPGWGFKVKIPERDRFHDAETITATFIGWEGRRAVFQVERDDDCGITVEPFRGEAPAEKAGRPHRHERKQIAANPPSQGNYKGPDRAGKPDVDGNR